MAKTENIQQGITAIEVEGYKSLYDRSKVEIRSLTLLAGANSSGKSSIIQPLLLLKQTLEASYDPGALLLNGSNVRFTSSQQIFSKISPDLKTDSFTIKICCGEQNSMSLTFGKKRSQKAIEILEALYQKEEEIIDLLPIKNLRFLFIQQLFLAQIRDPENKIFPAQLLDNNPYSLISFIKNLIHVPGVRGNPQRAYQTSAVDQVFPGTFENYIASIIQNWQSKRDKQLSQLTRNLSRLGLTKRIQANSLNEAEVELQVGRSLASGSKEMVSIADVGFGVSQILPVLVALLVAKPEQLVYIEQPEIHLHPRAQVALAEILIDAANRGVRVVIETHSELLLLAIQSLVSENKIRPDQVRLHWFTRLENGASQITSAELDETGAFGDWPEDFGEVSLGLHDRYLSAAEAKLWAAQS
jgi:predicted ATPase